MMKESKLRKIYNEEIFNVLKERLGCKNVHEVPYVEKIVINSGVKAVEEKTRVKEVQEDITKITGQKAVLTKARKSISNFKLREGMPVGVKVTLRGKQRDEFLYKLINIVLPNIRDFRGLPKKMDGGGNYNFGINDHTIFPEISIEGNKKQIGMDITIVTTADNDKNAFELLKMLGMPFKGLAEEKK